MTNIVAEHELAAAAALAPRAGTQSLSRGLQLLRMVATRPKVGWRLSDLAVACKQEKATVHRILARLVDERLVVQRPSDRHYLPGPLMFELGLALTEHTEFQRRAEPLVTAFARRMGGICLLQFRSGNEYVCSVRAGTLTLTGLMVYEGTRRPLFTSAGGVAILQTLPPDEARRILLDNVASEIARQGTTRLAALQKMRERSDEHGFGVNFGDVVHGSYAFGMPVRNTAGEAFAALCLVGTPELYGEHRLEEIRREMEAAAASLEAEARSLHI
ncbi:helix-turn-helix domain-containing protein [Ramlibacter sp. G-1-2-2]|uniref:Helix-turn-helix domain-containing protein n=1 Tax=Ramlibacter agri TaxID=2728837 RepID=A0A848HAF3_9BURK|nr:helix-turn-helix domain-containing protein [Ramlibacter agri]NML47437.1 helix-turn-helix domain-containing protein [Ramlibacter agri]